MKWLIVLVMIVNGQLSYTEVRQYDTRKECLAELSRMIDLYVKDGRRLEDMNGWCYRDGDQ